MKYLIIWLVSMAYSSEIEFYQYTVLFYVQSIYLETNLMLVE